MVYDRGNRRLTWIGTDGGLGRSEPTGVGFLSLDGVTDGGTLLFSAYFFSMTRGEPGPARLPNPIVAASVEDPDMLDTVAILDGVGIHRNGQGSPGAVAFTPYGYIDAYEDGWVYAPGDVAEIVWYDAVGGVVQRARWPADPLPLNDSVRSAYLDHAVETFGGDDPEAARAQFEEMLARQQADHLPPGHLPVTGPGGETWAGVYPVVLFGVPRSTRSSSGTAPTSGRWRCRPASVSSTWGRTGCWASSRTTSTSSRWWPSPWPGAKAEGSHGAGCPHGGTPTVHDRDQ